MNNGERIKERKMFWDYARFMLKLSEGPTDSASVMNVVSGAQKKFDAKYDGDTCSLGELIEGMTTGIERNAIIYTALSEKKPVYVVKQTLKRNLSDYLDKAVMPDVTANLAQLVLGHLMPQDDGQPRVKPVYAT